MSIILVQIFDALELRVALAADAASSGVTSNMRPETVNRTTVCPSGTGFGRGHSHTHSNTKLTTSTTSRPPIPISSKDRKAEEHARRCVGDASPPWLGATQYQRKRFETRPNEEMHGSGRQRCSHSKALICRRSPRSSAENTMWLSPASPSNPPQNFYQLAFEREIHLLVKPLKQSSFKCSYTWLRLQNAWRPQQRMRWKTATNKVT